MFIFFYGMLFLLGAFLVGYVYLYLRRALRTFGVDTRKWQCRFVLLVLAIVLAAVGMQAGMGAVIVIHIIMFSVMLGVLHLLMRLLVRNKQTVLFRKWKWVYGSGLIPVILAAGFIGYGYFNMHHVVSTEYTISTAKTIREEGYKVALIADVHYGVSLNRSQLKAVRDRISAEQADMVILCGDIVDDDTTYDEMQEVISVLGSIESRYGVFYVFGNHDRPFSFAEDASDYTEEQLVAALETAGVRILQDEVYGVTEDFTIVGRDDRSFAYRASLESLMLDADPEDFILTLDHQPNEYAINAALGTDLLLSGHTHGGQIWPLDIVQEIIPFNDAVYGHYQIDEDSQAIVTSGLAGWMFPIKTAAPAEYVVIEIEGE